MRSLERLEFALLGIPVHLGKLISKKLMGAFIVFEPISQQGCLCQRISSFDGLSDLDWVGLDELA